MYMFIVWDPIEFSRLHNLHPWYWNSLLYGLISSRENATHFLQLMSFTNLHFHSTRYPSLLGGLRWHDMRGLPQHLYTWLPAWLEHWSPIQVLTGLSIAYLQWSDENWLPHGQLLIQYCICPLSGNRHMAKWNILNWDWYLYYWS